MKNFYILLFLIPFFSLSQKKLRDSVFVKTDIFEIIYSEKLQQPLSASYVVKCPNGKSSRTGMDFYTCDSIVTSDDKDYKNNIYDKGHLVPASDFSCTKDMLYKTFTYLNCSLQNQDLNRGVWKSLESHVREIAKNYKEVTVQIKCVYSKSSLMLPSGSTVPDGYFKTIKYGNVIERYFFKNEKPIYSDFNKYKLSN